MTDDIDISAATPRPWHVREKYLFSSDGVVPVLGSHYPAAMQFGTVKDEAEANAALIIRAVNRDHLFEPMREALAAIVDYVDCGVGYNVDEWIDKARAALAQSSPQTTGDE